MTNAHGLESPPLISVLLPVHNAGRFLAPAVDSILSQTCSDFELLAIDDGSTDRSRETLERFAARDSRVRVRSRSNTGYAVALNEAIEMARGEYFARMDADDISEPVRFARQVEFLRAHPDCVAVGCRVLLIDEDGDFVGEPPYDFGHEEIVKKLLIGYGGTIPHPGLMARASVMRDLGGYRVHHEPVEDLDLYLHLTERGRVANHPDVLLKYRQHPRSVCVLRYDEQIRKADAIVREAYDRKGEPVGPDFSLPGWPRPVDSERTYNWFWWALQKGHTSTARKYARRIVLSNPFSKYSWRIAYCAIRGH